MIIQNMKHFLTLLGFLILPYAVSAQEIDSTVYGYDVRYISDHLFLQRDSDFNVVDYTIEWPEVISFNRLEALKRCITKQLFGFESADIDSSLVAYTRSMGTPVTGQLKSLPDDRRFCYSSLKAELKSFSQGRWASYFISAEVKPESLSAETPRRQSLYVTYDMIGQKLLTSQEMLNKDIERGQVSPNFYKDLFAPFLEGGHSNMQQSVIDGVWLKRDKIAFHVQIQTLDDNISYEVDMPYAKYSKTLSKTARQLITGKPVVKKPYMQMLPLTVDGDTVYKKVENMPVFPGGWENTWKLWEVMPRINWSETVGMSVRVLFSYVVDKEGRVRDMRMLSDSHPAIGRYLAERFKGLSGFTPGMHEGHKVCVRMTMPLRFSMD